MKRPLVNYIVFTCLWACIRGLFCNHGQPPDRVNYHDYILMIFEDPFYQPQCHSLVDAKTIALIKTNTIQDNCHLFIQMY